MPGTVDAAGSRARAAPGRAALPWIALAALLLHLAVLLPHWPGALRAAAFLRLPLEPAVLLLALALAPRRAARALRAAIVAVLTGLTILRLADLGAFQALGRPFNPVLDLGLLASGWALASDSVGLSAALAIVGAAALAVLLCAALLWRGLAEVAALPRAARRGLAGALAGLVLTGGALLALAPEAAGSARLQAELVPGAAARAARLRAALRDLADFDVALATDPLSPSAADPPRFAALAGRDVVLIFVESYGRSFLEAPAFAAISGPRLAAVEARLAGAGLSMRSGWLTSPIRGGQSWLAHATFLGGLRVDSQARYDRLIASERRSLNRLFGHAGWRTAALMPAIVAPWPEAAWYGYDTVLDAAGLAYAGQPFDWVTMPDQFTLSRLEALRQATPGPLMAEVALITSHAPWTPLPLPIPWEKVGDGAIFDGRHRTGAPPAEVWRNVKTVRAAYARSLDYALEIVGQYVARADDGALIIVLGDHQPAPLVTGDGASADVPIHVIAREPSLLAGLKADRWEPGLRPSAALPAQSMAAMRALIAEAFERP